VSVDSLIKLDYSVRCAVLVQVLRSGVLVLVLVLKVDVLLTSLLWRSIQHFSYYGFWRKYLL